MERDAYSKANKHIFMTFCYNHTKMKIKHKHKVFLEQSAVIHLLSTALHIFALKLFLWHENYVILFHVFLTSLEENNANLAFVSSLTVWEGETNASKPFLFTAKFCKNKKKHKLNPIIMNLKYRPQYQCLTWPTRRWKNRKQHL